MNTGEIQSPLRVNKLFKKKKNISIYLSNECMYECVRVYVCVCVCVCVRVCVLDGELRS